MKKTRTGPSVGLSKKNPKHLIEKFLHAGRKLSLLDKEGEGDRITILQSHDQKSISFYKSDIEKVLPRRDGNGEDFLQINFKNGKKILLTDEFVGFPPALHSPINTAKLPKVVTTADLLSVIEAIESSLYGTDQYQESLSDVKLFFDAIAGGAEAVGFNLIGERLWVERLFPKIDTAGAV